MSRRYILGWVTVALALFCVFALAEGKQIGESVVIAVLGTIGGITGGALVEKVKGHNDRRKNQIGSSRPQTRDRKSGLEK
jgi:hypothetical protein